MIICIIGR